jgi:pyruvate dehydrogenase E1 component
MACLRATTAARCARVFAQTVDGQLQTFAAKNGRYNRENFFGQNAELARLAEGLTDDQIDRLKRGGHDPVKIHAAYAAAAAHRGQPTVILAQTKKGYGMGSAGQGRMTTHSQKKLDDDELLEFRRPLQAAAVRRADHPSGLLQASARGARDALPARAPRRAGWYDAAARIDLRPLAGAAAAQLRPVRAGGRQTRR